MPIFLQRMKEYTYEKLGGNEPVKQPKTTFNWQLGIPWLLSTLLALFSGYLLLSRPPAAHGAFDVFHSLHCLNYLRMYLDKDYYADHIEHMEAIGRNFTHMPNNWGQMHLHHCLQQVVQSVICHADLSPVPMYGWKGVPVLLGVGQTHTCRKWEPIREWMDARNAVRTPIEEQ
ncbi:hypothetical protein BDV26DRAFT_299666 [Aspergillus bertholletiae]|uniref:Uncharacterized protein n=1 Tax=Aspergillus bertholletiae TaxID=1226010 RepID=A0A5N7AZV9_9EURO|nr:hypothetical protein BDV26DRAFT_299666 [Aspergillus bertholletiae]